MTANPAGARPIELADDGFVRSLAAARARDELAFVAVRVGVVAAPSALLAAWPDAPAVAWSSGVLALAGIGIARELRGHGASRLRSIVAGAAGIGDTAFVDGERVLAGALGFARPRFVGGAAFSPGAASHGPWLGFGDAWFVLPRWTYVHDGSTAYLVLAIDAHDAGDVDRWCGELAIHRAALAAVAAPEATVATEQPAAIAVTRGSPEQWRAQVEEITTAIARGACSKIVAARTCVVGLAGPVQAAALLATLDIRHADCARALIRPPGAGTLVAATPERLVRRDGTLVECDALAGTIRATGPHAAATLLASAKDRREHDLVVRAIRSALAVTGATVEAPADPGIRELRHVLHLHTPFRARLAGPRHVLELVELLHPTPAVGGTPTDVAIDWIGAHEPVPRGWYASPIGWFDLDGNGEFAVAIRSGVLTGHRAHLWAGAGIVAGSDPDRELAETELKLRAMLGALGVVAGRPDVRAPDARPEATR